MKSKLSLKLAIILICVGFLPLSCGTSKMAQQKESLLKIQKPLVIEKTGDDDRPEWTSERPFFEDNNGLHFIGCIMDGVDYALTLRLAKSEATKNLLESIQIKAQAEFSHAIQGQNKNDRDLGRYVTDAVAWTIDNLRISGIRQNKAYYEKVFDPISQTIKFNAWVQLEIPKIDYLQAKTDSARKLLDKAIQDKNQEAKEKALELLEKLQQEV
jgi:hypothetical protein